MIAEREPLIIPRGMPGESQAIELCISAAGAIEAILLPVRDSHGGVCFRHWQAAWRLFPSHSRNNACDLAQRWGCRVISTPAFARKHMAAGTPHKPAAQQRIFFARG